MPKIANPKSASTIKVAPEVAAKSAGLQYSNDQKPGITRKKHGKGFQFIGPDNKPFVDNAELERILKLAIPPAWKEVWICPSPNGHIQATGRDERGRKQYRYHDRWREVRDASKYDRVMAFGKLLPKIRKQILRDLKLSGLPRRKVLAVLMQLLERSLIRVGNDEYAKANHSFGLTTMQDKHASIKGATLQFKFLGKSGVRHNITIQDRRLANAVKRCQELPGQELFQYEDDEGNIHDITSADVNDYLREITGADFSAKDFRTWAGTVLASIALSEFEAFDSEVQAKKNVVQAIERVAERLGNTPSICRKCYIHPEVIHSYLDGSMIEVLQDRLAADRKTNPKVLKPEEAAVLALLENRLAREAKKKRSK